MNLNPTCYKKFLIIAGLIIGGVLVLGLSNQAQAANFECVCKGPGSTPFIISGTGDGLAACNIACASSCRAPGDCGASYAYQVCQGCSISDCQQEIDGSWGCAEAPAPGGCDPPCDSFAEDCVQDSEPPNLYHCVPKSAAGCPGGCPTGEECRWNDIDGSWGCEAAGVTPVDCGGSPCYGTCSFDDYDQPLCVPSGGAPAGPGQPAGPGPGQPAGPPAILPNPIGVNTVAELILRITRFIVSTIAIPFAILMIILAGFRFATAQGNEEKLTVAKKNFMWTVLGVGVVLAANAIVIYVEELLGASGGGTLNAFINRIKGTLNIVIGVLFALVTVYFIWGVIQYVVGAQGDEQKLAQGKRHMFWGIIGMTIMGAALGIVRMIAAYVQ